MGVPQDLAVGIRALRRTPGYTAVSVAVVALAVGSTTAVFSLVNGVLLQPLPFSEPERLVAVWETVRRPQVERREASYPDFSDWRERSDSFERLGAVAASSFTLGGEGDPRQVRGELVSHDYFELLGVRLSRGRGFSSTEDDPGGEPAVVISDGYWRRQLGADPGLLGRELRVDGRNATLVGIAPPGFAGLTEAEIWVPIAGPAGVGGTRLVENPAARWHRVVGRLRSGVDLPAAQEEMSAIAARLENERPDSNRDRGVILEPLAEGLVGRLRPALLALLGAVGFVLLIACANVANLTLVRHAARRREMAVRAALGAGRGRLVRQLVVESGLLASLGGAAGIVLALWIVEIVSGLDGIRLPRFASVELDGRALAAAAGATLLAGVCFGLLPAWGATRLRLRDALGSQRSGAPASSRTRNALVVTELALALVLLGGAGLMVRSLVALQAMNAGFSAEATATMRVVFPEREEGGDDATARRAEELLARVQGLGSVREAALASDLPLGPNWSATIMRIEGRDDATQQGGIRVYRHDVSPGLLETLGIPLRRGRSFVAGERGGPDADAVIVSQAFARRHLPGEDPLDHLLLYGSRRLRIVGVAGDVKYRELLEADSADPDVYLPFSARPGQAFSLAVRSGDTPEALADAVRGELRRLDPEAPVFEVASLGGRLRAQGGRTRFVSVLLGAFAAAALALAALGLYGVVAYAVGRRVHEIGTRMALGATARDVRSLVLGEGLRLVGAGVVLGLAFSLALGRGLQGLLVGIPPTDPITHVVTAGLLAGVALLAGDAPARRAARVDPAEALRSE
jgi:putative ABC transport system permease protein